VQDAHVRVLHKREQVAVSGHDLDRPARALGDRCDDVLGLVAIGRAHRDSECVEQLDDDLHLRSHGVRRVVGSRDAVRLVRRHGVDPELGSPVGVQRDDELRRAAIRKKTREEVQETERRIHVRAVGSLPLGNRVIGAIREAGRVDEECRAGYRRAAGAAKTVSSAAMKRSFSAGVPIEARRHPSHPGQIEMSRMRTLCSRNRAWTSGGFSFRRRNRMKFVTDGKTSIAGTRRSAVRTRSRSRLASSRRCAIACSSRATRAATASVSVLTLYGSAAAVKYPMRSGWTMSTPTRKPAAASTLENVFEMTRFGNSSIRETSDLPAKSEYASSTRTSVSGNFSATARMTSASISPPVGLFGVVNTTISGRALAIVASARSFVTS